MAKSTDKESWTVIITKIQKTQNTKKKALKKIAHKKLLIKEPMITEIKTKSTKDLIITTIEDLIIEWITKKVEKAVKDSKAEENTTAHNLEAVLEIVTKALNNSIATPKIGIVTITPETRTIEDGTTTENIMALSTKESNTREESIKTTTIEESKETETTSIIETPNNGVAIIPETTIKALTGTTTTKRQWVKTQETKEELVAHQCKAKEVSGVEKALITAAGKTTEKNKEISKPGITKDHQTRAGNTKGHETIQWTDKELPIRTGKTIGLGWPTAMFERISKGQDRGTKGMTTA